MAKVAQMKGATSPDLHVLTENEFYRDHVTRRMLIQNANETDNHGNPTERAKHLRKCLNVQFLL